MSLLQSGPRLRVPTGAEAHVTGVRRWIYTSVWLLLWTGWRPPEGWALGVSSLASQGVMELYPAWRASSGHVGGTSDQTRPCGQQKGGRAAPAGGAEAPRSLFQAGQARDTCRRRGSGRGIDGNGGLGPARPRPASPSGLASVNMSVFSLIPRSQEDVGARPVPNRKHSGFLKMVFKSSTEVLTCPVSMWMLANWSETSRFRGGPRTRVFLQGPVRQGVTWAAAGVETGGWDPRQALCWRREGERGRQGEEERGRGRETEGEGGGETGFRGRCPGRSRP